MKVQNILALMLEDQIEIKGSVLLQGHPVAFWEL